MSYAVVSVFFGISILELIICSLLIGFFIIHRNNPQIRRNSYLVTLTILIGVAISALGVLLLSFGRTDAFCWITFYTHRLGIFLIVTGLFAKNYRIYKIFTNQRASAIDLSETSLLAYIGIFTIIFLGIPTIIFIIFGYYAVVKQSKSNIYYQYVQCIIPNETWDLIVQLIMDISVLLIVLASLILAWLTRRVQADYQESRSLAAFSVVLLTSSIVLIPLGKTLKGETNSELLRYVIFVEFVSIVIFAALGLLFFPKVYVILKEKSKRKRRIERIDE